jgi:heme o synthase
VGGYALFPAPQEIATLWGVLAGVTLLAGGGSALNQVMERDIDALMTRTKLRPLPTGELVSATAAALGTGAVLAGLAILAAAGGLLPALFGALSIAIYLGLYTPLKRRTPLALLAGAFCGALTPVIGWCAAGGNPADFRIALPAGLLYLWQIPHFWLFQKRHTYDYRRAGIPVLASAFEGRSPAALCRLWLAALIAGSMLLPAFGMIGRGAALCAAAFPLVLLFRRFRSETALFSCLNLFPLLLTIAFLVGQ